MRIGVLFQDGSICIMSKRFSDDEQLKEARDMREAANRGAKKPRLAKVVSIDIDESDMVEIEGAQR